MWKIWCTYSIQSVWTQVVYRRANAVPVWLFACLQIVVNCVYMTAESAGIPVIPTARVPSSSPAISCLASGSGPTWCSPSAAPQCFCWAELSQLLTETIALIWIIKGVRHYDTVSPCREGQHTNIQAHTISPSSSHHFWSEPWINYRRG